MIGYPAGLLHGDTFYTVEGKEVPLTVTGNPSEGHHITSISASAGVLTDNSLKMPASDVVISANQEINK